ncbi:hypothetical protein KGQ31_01620 [Patescibacteria group bacterium]|nr:hypothetical protein [Patescibacteria group bacterium]
MKTRNHILIAVVLMVSIVPSLAYAAWWNPFSWFSWLKQANKPRAVQNETNTYATSTPTATTTLEATGSTLKLGADKQPALSDQTSEIEKLKKQIEELKNSQTKNTDIPTPQPSDNTPKTKTLPNGMIIDDKGNILNLDQYVQTQKTNIQTPPTPSPAPDYKSIGENYFDAHKTCVGLDNPSQQYNYCVNYSLNQTQPAQQTPQQISNQQNQQKTNRVNTLTSQYNSDIRKLEQQIIDIKTQHYADTAAAQSYGGSQSSVDGQIQNLTNAANLKIQKIQLQEQQLYLDYQNNLSNL